MPIFENIDLIKQLPTYAEISQKNMLLVRFRHVTDGKIFRYNRSWWVKINFKLAKNGAANPQEISSAQPVGVLVKDLNPSFKDYIIKSKDDLKDDQPLIYYGQT